MQSVEAAALVAREAQVSSHSGTRVARILRVLAASPVPMSTPQILAAVAEGIGTGQRALTWYGNALRRLEMKGYVAFAGWTGGDGQRGPAARWSITDAGRGQLARWEAAAAPEGRERGQR
jgi:DNA-binding PadR family transcriptional regulator